MGRYWCTHKTLKMKIQVEFDLKEIHISDSSLPIELIREYLKLELNRMLYQYANDCEDPQLWIDISDDGSDYDIMNCNVYGIKLATN